MKILFCIFIMLLFASQASADCAGIPGKLLITEFDGITMPLYLKSGAEVKGCILHSEHKILGYATDPALCKQRLREKVKVRLAYGCCDTGPDDGDIECVARSQPFLGINPVHANGVWVHKN